MNAIFTQSADRIAKGGGLWFVAPYDADKKIGDNWLSILNADAAAGVEALTVLDDTGFPATGALNIGAETGLSYSDVTDNVVTCETTTEAHDKGDILTVVGTDGYASFSYFGFSEKTSLDPGIPEATNVITETGDIPRSFAGAEEPMVTITVQQGLINEMALFHNRDVEATQVNGAYEVGDTKLPDLAAFYIVKRDNGKFLVFKYARLSKSGAAPIDFSNEFAPVDVTFKVLEGGGDGWDKRIYGEN